MLLRGGLIGSGHAQHPAARNVFYSCSSTTATDWARSFEKLVRASPYRRPLSSEVRLVSRGVGVQRLHYRRLAVEGTVMVMMMLAPFAYTIHQVLLA